MNPCFGISESCDSFGRSSVINNCCSVVFGSPVI